MANTLLTPSMITREALRVLHNNIVFAKGVNKQYSDEFARKEGKIGNTINVRKPPQYYVRDGKTMQTQAATETYVAVELTNQWGVDINFSSQELSTSIDDFSERFIKPAMAKLASHVDYQGLALAKDVYNQVGTPGSTPGTNTGSGLLVANTPGIFLNAGAVLDMFACPRDENRNIVLNPQAMAGSVSGLSGLYQDQGRIADQYRNGMMGRALGFNFAMDQNVNTLTTGAHAGTYTDFKVDGADQTGSTLHIDGFTASTATITAGEVFTIAGVYSVNPENQQSTGELARFTVVTGGTVDGSGDIDLTISPSIVVAGTGVANGTVNAGPADGALISFLSLAAVSTQTAETRPMNLAYHKDAFTLATADLILPEGVHFAARETYDGISMRIIRQYDINNDNMPCRIDILGGWKTLRPEFACRIAG